MRHHDWIFCLALAAGCGADAAPAPSPDASVSSDAGAPADKAAPCASTFGGALTRDFGRLDGTLHAVVGPTDTQCALPNDDHLVVQVAMGGAVYRIVINVLSDGRNGTDTRLRYQALAHPLVGGPWAEGWHPGATLDYATTLGAHSTTGFEPVAMAALVERVTARLVLGARISAFATSSGGTRAASAHLVHRGQPALGEDGALVLDPDGPSPTYLLFHFDGSEFRVEPGRVPWPAEPSTPVHPRHEDVAEDSF